jgi:hypothetical protein
MRVSRVMEQFECTDADQLAFKLRSRQDKVIEVVKVGSRDVEEVNHVSRGTLTEGK